ncbi:serine-rich adhesin for platelets-like isoform X1 [Leptidea sinapis]|uniref:serine-rich adhesin for platelets-like isoform X1 n=1 Tax=Leptidea sinapis TaxID=189913 RepID=UPI00213D1ED0|nr:serine-rich adhesin for platelets-like isoform X1 [Leptidea sinapis]XP_050679364.1 serine-rich adhesin for platelets-like isoform X2 [Leptidea sinapis]XP_050679365.1 serine-rich adhesin for platelets-like isoform X3 [Leptidea sinapis]XP_050679366.1 serine-rich adhesin for platelets-like isoform X4 [Leptidea sinapis]XP_050679367.1 serine-rich adhesin for platelets-like isoform X5 [Leptidea sinapis]XP_050679368.1 serine-rich adhesin for platelets-like isoform X6 [Leptidea sinapis]XP_05067936
MESPVRICLGVSVVILLLLSSALVNSYTLTNETITHQNETQTNIGVNVTTQDKLKIPDVTLNELQQKHTSEENTEKNAKYKDRGRVKFNPSKSTTESALRRIKSTTKASLVIVTPTPEAKKPIEIIDSMRNFKKSKLPTSTTTTTTTTTTVESDKEELDSEEEDSEQENDDDNTFDKYTFMDNFFTNFDTDHGFGINSNMRQASVKNQDFSTPQFDSFSSYFPKETYKSDNNHFKNDNFFNFDRELTTPKNDFFDKKYEEISSSILKRLDTIKGKTTPINNNTHNVVKENIGYEKVSNESPHNRSTVIIKNTKEIRLLDNDEAGSGTDNKALSDVHGTSIYYEMSVLSTETYNITHTNDDDCDNDTIQPEVTPRTPLIEELASVIPSQNPIIETPTQYSILIRENEVVSTVAPFITSSSIPIDSKSLSSPQTSTQNMILSTESTKIQNRNRNYSKRLNLTGTKEITDNSAVSNKQATPNQINRSQTRRFHNTTPKAKPVWMAPRRNVTRTSMRIPTTIYSEYFDIKNKFFTTQEPGSAVRVLSTQSSDIDPILQSDVSGTKIVVKPSSIADNTIPSLRKRGSTRFSTSSSTTTTTSTSSTMSSATTLSNGGIKDLEIPPTLTAWALASLRSPPSLASPINITQKSIDENELQNVGEISDKTETITSSTSSTPIITMNQEFLAKNVTDIEQNQLLLKPLATLTSEADFVNEKTSETIPAESNISPQNSTEIINKDNEGSEIKTSKVETQTKESPWISASENLELSPTQDTKVVYPRETIQAFDTKKSTGFESITKLPSDMTTPSDTESSEDKNEMVTTKPTPLDNYEITTIRFPYVPTEDITDNTETDSWHYAGPTRTKPTTVDNNPITTYRPKYFAADTTSEESSITPVDTTLKLELSTPYTEITTVKDDKTIDTLEKTTTVESTVTETDTTVKVTTPLTSTEDSKSTELETTTIIVSIATEINTEIGKDATEVPTTTNVITNTNHSEENSESNEVITQEAKSTTEEAKTTTQQTKQETTTIIPMTTTERFEITTIVNESETKGAVVSTTELPRTTRIDIYEETTTEAVTVTTYAEEVTTEASSRVRYEAGSGATIAVAVSAIGIAALILLIVLLVVVRRRGRRGVYAQRCTPVSLDAYSLDSVSVGQRKGNLRIRASKRSYGNPAYDDEVTSHPMSYAALANFAMDVDSITAEFAEIPSVSVRPEEVPPGCEDKNRYSNVLPLPETRVPLRRIGNDPTTEYINANYITGPGNIRNFYIACQAPLSNTVVDFWRMIWEQNSRTIVMLTEYMESGVEKCYEYLPPSEISDNRRTFGQFQVILKKREQQDKYAISSVQLINLATRTWREVTHLWYFWPAKGVPEDYDSVIDFLSEMRSYMKISQTAKEYDEEGIEVIYEDQSRSSYNNLSKLRSEDHAGNGVNVYSPAKAEEVLRRGYGTNGTLGKMKVASELEGVRPCVVVCASGAGRSAAIIAADICARALVAGAADLPRTVRALRTQRPHSISNRHHYIFLYKLLSEYGNRLLGGVDNI